MAPYQIFLVEDHPVMREAYVGVLEREPDLVLCGMAESAEEALGRIADATCDVIVTDVSLPGMDGIEFLVQAQARRPDLPVVVISAYGDAELARRAYREGARAYLHKDTLGTHLAATLRAVLQAAGC